MDENQTRQNNLLDTTDCLEAIGVFRGWKNGLFVIVILCLLLLQGAFWLVDQGYIEPCAMKKWGALAAVCEKATGIKESSVPAEPQEQEAEKAIEGPNTSAEAEPQTTKPKAGFFPDISFKHLCRVVRFVNGFLILAAVLYCLSMLFSLKVSLIGRLGGINHISQAFFLSLVLVILLLPWQIVFDGIIPGVLYTPCELVKQCSAERSSIFATAIHYLRFTGYWLLAVLFLIFAQLRSGRWAKSVLRRLEVI